MLPGVPFGAEDKEVSSQRPSFEERTKKDQMSVKNFFIRFDVNKCYKVSKFGQADCQTGCF